MIRAQTTVIIYWSRNKELDGKTGILLEEAQGTIYCSECGRVKDSENVHVRVDDVVYLIPDHYLKEAK